MKNQKGITLIALIITIIVMLILAGIAISTLVSEDGVLTKAEDVKLIQVVAAIQEKLKLAVADDEIGNITELEKYQNITLEKLQNDEIEPITNYSDYRDFMGILKIEILYWSYGNLYRNDTEELIGEDLLWIPTEIITGEEFFAEEGFGEMFQIQRLNINTELGRVGTTEIIEDGDGLEPYGAQKDMFFIDNKYNVYYMAENGDVATANGIIKEENVSSIDPELLNGAAGPAFNGIKDAALEFTGDNAYAKLISENDLDVDSSTNTFYMGGYITTDIVDKTTNQPIKEDLAFIMFDTNYGIQDIFGRDEVWYLMEYDETTNKYAMYKYDRINGIGYDKDGNSIKNVTHTNFNGCKKDINNDGNEYNGYGYIERFDGRDAIIGGIFETKVIEDGKLNMQEDLKDFSFDIKYWYPIENEEIKELTLPASINSLEILALTRGEESGSNFAGTPNLTYLKLPDNLKIIYPATFEGLNSLTEVIMPKSIETIYSTAFKGLTQDITVRFPGGKEVSGKPWGAEGNITVITGNN